MWIGLFKKETIVLPHKASDVAAKLWWVTKSPHIPRESGPTLLFNGWVDEMDFEVSRIITHPENYLPVITGKIEATSTGTIIFIQYHLFFSTLMFLCFSSAFCLLFGVFLMALRHSYFYGGATLFLGLVNYTIAMANFNLQVRKSREVLYELLVS